MYLARILYPVEVLGPGKRIGLWLCGCPHHCDGCSNPELWEIQEKYSISVNDVVRVIQSIADNNTVDGFTITGGEPFQQADELTVLLKRIKVIASDILVYTGYTIDELDYTDRKALEHVSVLIDGRYIQELNDEAPLRGSANQQMNFLEPELREKYEAYLAQGNKIQNFTLGNSVISVGIHNANYNVSLIKKAEEHGLQGRYYG